MPASTSTGNAILNFYLRGVDATLPARVWLSLHTADPGGNGANEVSTDDWPNYARQDPAAGAAIATGFAAAANKLTVNAKQMDFARHTGEAGVTIGYVCIWSDEEGGTPSLTGQLVDSEGEPTTKTILPGDECVIYAGEAMFGVL